MISKFAPNYKKTCIICGTIFQPTNTKSLTCLPQCSRERKRKYDKYYRKKYPEKIAAWTRKSAKKNRDRVNRNARRRYRKDKDIMKVRNETYRLIKKLGKGGEGHCFDCQETNKLEIHHITYTRDDFVLLCQKCHMKRHGKILHTH